MSAPDDPPLGRRDRKRRHTREALADAALDLFEEKGFTATSIEDITERADVARRTFFRHFASKEAVLFPPPEDYEARLVAALDAQPAPLTLARVLDAFAAAATAMEDDARKRRRAAVVLDNQVHVGRAAWQAFLTIRETLAAHIGARGGLPADDPRVHLAANLGLLVVSEAYIRWTAGVDGTTLAAELDRTVELLRGLVDGDVLGGGPLPDRPPT